MKVKIVLQGLFYQGSSASVLVALVVILASLLFG